MDKANVKMERRPMNGKCLMDVYSQLDPTRKDKDV